MVTGISFPYIEAGCPSASPQNSAEAAVWGQQKSQPGANTAENVCHDMPQPCEGCRGAGTACFLLLSLEIKSESGPTGGGEVGGFFSAPVLPEHKLPGGLAGWFGGERNKKIHVWHHKGVSSGNS